MRLALALLVGIASPAAAQDIASARLADPTDRYGHAVLGDALEWGALDLVLTDGQALRITLPRSRVFEDITARIGDFDGDGRTEVMVVETSVTLGAMLAIYDAGGKRAATAPIGQANRWLAPAGWGDFDGDGRIEIAYIDRPHLVKDLVLLRLDGRRLTEIARAPGFTNHRIGEDRIVGGTQTCAGQDRLILASADWTRRQAITLRDGRILAQDLGPWRDGPLPACP